ncbi:MAG TPA: carbohydrate kinase family protein [Burkholderiaceae bacterium]|jgi:adenosine kinase|nr:carbohydrate kinase family protein [Burkholderiaceae bacterium]
MTKRVLISGSVAFDTIMVFDGFFKDHILPDRVHMLNVSFLTPRLKREFGGCAANIAYNLSQLGGQPAILAAVGHDGADYVQRLAQLGVDTRAIARFDDQFTAQAFITTDLADNQITAFHPGAMGAAHHVGVAGSQPAAWGIVAPNGKQAMLRHAAEFAEQRIPFLFDPGQGLPMFGGDELRELISRATGVAVNDYECGLLTEKTGWSERKIAETVQALIVTRGAEGSVLHESGRTHAIPAAPIARAVDPTGCGDAYRAGLLYGLAEGHGWLQSARLGSVLGAIKIEHQGPQNHAIDRDDVARRFREAYGTTLGPG